jgi:lysophospholipase
MHGNCDELGFTSGSQEFAEQVPGDCTLKIWEGMGHEIHNEPEKEQVMRFVVKWLSARI